jgi:hypothetical protein
LGGFDIRFGYNWIESVGLKLFHRTIYMLSVAHVTRRNIPNISGELLCDGERQEAILEAARARRGYQASSGGGAMLLVISGSSHNTFADPLALFSEHVGWVFRMLGLTARLDPVLGIHLVALGVLNFLSTHLPLSADQRQLQTWAPSAGYLGKSSLLSEIARLTAADAATSPSGPLSWLFPGRGLLYTVSDWLLDRTLRLTRRNGDATAPEDVLSGEEILETAMPSADPASGPHPHAPRELVTAGMCDGIEKDLTARRLDQRQAQVLRSGLGTRFADCVRQAHIDEYTALLGEEHVWKCEVSE